MSDDQRALLVEVSHLLAARNFTTATGGNISLRLPDGGCWVTPSRLHKARVQLADLVRVDADGCVVTGTRLPSSETFMHLAAYRALPRAGAIIHAHPPAATGFAQARKPIETTSSSEAFAILGPEVPLLPFAHPGTQELADQIGAAMQPSRRAYLLAHHGVLTWGENLWDAYDTLDTLELYTQTLLAAAIAGGAIPLPEEDLAILAKKYHQQ